MPLLGCGTYVGYVLGRKPEAPHGSRTDRPVWVTGVRAARNACDLSSRPTSALDFDSDTVDLNHDGHGIQALTAF